METSLPLISWNWRYVRQRDLATLGDAQLDKCWRNVYYSSLVSPEEDWDVNFMMNALDDVKGF